MSKKVSTNHPVMDIWFDGGYKIGETYLFTVEETDILGCHHVIDMLLKGREDYRGQVYEASYAHIETVELANLASIIDVPEPELMVIHIENDEDYYDPWLIRENMEDMSLTWNIPVVLVASSKTVAYSLIDVMNCVISITDSSTGPFWSGLVRCVKNRGKNINLMNPFSFII